MGCKGSYQNAHQAEPSRGVRPRRQGAGAKTAGTADAARPGEQRMDRRFQEIPRERVADRIASELLRMISSGELAPGERLPGERQLADMLGVSRSAERRVGKECVSKCRSRWWPYH